MYRKPGKAIGTALICFFSFAIHAQSPAICLRPVQVSEATKENWAPGVVKENTDAAGGVLYRISVKIRKQGDITFENLIIDGQVLAIEAVKGNDRNVSGPFNKGDELVLIARSDKAEESSMPGQAVLNKLKEENAEGALLYSFRNKKYLRPIGTFEKKDINPLSR